MSKGKNAARSDPARDGTKRTAPKDPEENADLEPKRPANWQRWMDPFLKALRETNSVYHACDACRRSRTQTYLWREKCPEFAEAWNEAKLRAPDDLEVSVFQKAKDGWLEPIVYKGERRGFTRKYSPALAFQMLQKLKPEIYDTQKYDPTHREGEDEQEVSIAFYESVDDVRALRDSDSESEE